MKRIILSFLGYLVVLCALPSSLLSQEQKELLQPESDVEIGREFSRISDSVSNSLEAKNAGKSIVGYDWMVASANPYATDVGANILRRGGTAADAMVAVQSVLAVSYTHLTLPTN